MLLNCNSIKCFLLLIFLGGVHITKAQISKNFVKTWTATAPTQDPNALLTNGLREVKHTVSYFDGLGRPEQSIMKQGSLVTATGASGDVVSVNEYDAFGREVKKYLPYVSTSVDGLYKTNPMTELNSFNTTQYGGQGETFFYGQTDFEASPLNRPLKTMAPGNSWVGAGRCVTMGYWINTATDDVKIWNVTEVPNSLGTYSVSGAYPAGELYKNITADEKGSQVVEFKDKEGKVILKKVQIGNVTDNGSGSGYPNWLCTYYVYDDFGLLRLVIPPKAVDYLNDNNWPSNPFTVGSGLTVLNELCFQYAYDGRNRMIIKKVPGAGEVWMVYDIRDRLVMTTDTRMRNFDEGWLCTIYDDLNRPIKTFKWFNDEDRITTQQEALIHTNYPEIGLWYGAELLTETHYDDYTGLPSGLSSSLTGNYSGAITTTYNASPDYALEVKKTERIVGLPTWSKVKVLGSSNQFIVSATIYDENAKPIQVQSINQAGGLDVTTMQYDFAGKVLRTHTSHRNPNASATAIETVNKPTYDDLGRVTKLEKNLNNTGFKTISTMGYDALGQLVTKALGIKPGTTSTEIEKLTNEYNIRGWLLGVNRNFTKTKNSTTGNYFGFDLGYDKTSLNGSVSGSYTQAHYNGNIGGMLWKSIGDDVVRKYDFDYDNANRLTVANFQQNDATNAWNNNNINYTVNNLSYDANGNIKTMTQFGFKIGGSATIPIDELQYTYFDNSNKLKNVVDLQNDVASTLGDFKTTTSHPQYAAIKQGIQTIANYDNNKANIYDYGYDLNGNMISDRNKGINGSIGIDQSGGAITYNHLNLPYQITVTGKGTITYNYDAAGSKLQKTTQENNATVNYNNTNYTTNITTITRYTGGGVYESKSYSNGALAALNKPEALQFLGHEEGRFRLITPSGGGGAASWAADYFVKDHLGNIRMVLTDEVKVDPYPVASLEDGNINNEKQYYNIPDDAATRVNKSTVGGYPNYQYTNPNDYLHKLSGSGTKIGTSIVLKVMAGDKVDIRANSWYRLNGATPNPSTGSPVTDLVTALANGAVKAAGGAVHGATATMLGSGGILTPGITGFLTDQTNTYGSGNGKPKAFINWILFDEQLKYVAGSSSNADPVGGDQEFKTHLLQNIPMSKNGFLYIYESNETPNVNVFFDNLQVTHTKGPLVEETHYYPFGLTMSGISSKAANGIENKYLYNGKELQSKEFTDGSGLELYDYGARFYDAQIGRWHKTDNKAELYFATSPYVYALNQPTNAVDPDGNVVIFINGMHGGSGGKSEYWRKTVTTENKVTNPFDSHYGQIKVTRTHYDFDTRVMQQLGDDKPLYRDGAMGGLNGLNIQYGTYGGNEQASNRIQAGYNQGKIDAAKIIADLARDKNNNIIETIKVITHSMGGAYGNGFVKALKEYIRTLPIELQKQIKITLVADFDPFNGGDFTADSDIKTIQFKHKAKHWWNNIAGMGWLANEDEKGLDQENIKTNTGNSTSHTIFSFLGDISSLSEGTYKWDNVNRKFVKQ